MTNKHMERCTTLFIVRETQNNTTMRYCYKSIRMAEKLTISIIAEDVRKLGLLYTASGNMKLYNHFKAVWQFLKHLNTHVPYYPSIILLDIYPKEMRAYFQTNTCSQMF